MPQSIQIPTRRRRFLQGAAAAAGAGVLAAPRVGNARTAIPSFPNSWEMSGTSGIVESGTMIDDGNALGYVVTVGPTYGTALWYETYHPPSILGGVTQFDVTVLNSAMLDGKAITIAISKAAGDITSALRNWRIYLQRHGGDFQFNFVIGEDSGQTVWPFGPVQFGRVYQHYIEYDLVQRRIVWGIDGQFVNAMDMLSSAPRNVATHIIGSSGSSSGRDTQFLVERVIWQPI